MRLLLVDDHAVVREGVAALLQQARAGVQVVRAGDGEEALALVRRDPDLDAVLLDLVLPGMDGLRTIEALGRERADLPVIVLAGSEDPRDVRRALAAGALGYVPKSADPLTLLSALDFVLAGNVYLPPLLLFEDGGEPLARRAPSANESRLELTGRQVDVLKLLALGMPNKSIAQALGLSDKTVKVHVTAIFRSLNVVNRTQAAAAAREARLV
jgi:two-component system nitrate/nitrite response regulator NarL